MQLVVSCAVDMWGNEYKLERGNFNPHMLECSGVGRDLPIKAIMDDCESRGAQSLQDDVEWERLRTWTWEFYGYKAKRDTKPMPGASW